jgi:hypothetical protein
MSFNALDEVAMEQDMVTIFVDDGRPIRVDLTGASTAEQCNERLRAAGVRGDVRVLTREEAEVAAREREAANAEHARREAEARIWRDAVRAKVRDGRWNELTPEEQNWILSALEADYGDE